MRHQIGMKQYNPNKPAISLNDARFPHTYQSTVYARKPKNGDGPENHIKTLVENTGSKLPLDGRIISMDRLYTSISVANWLLERRITVVGTLMTNRIGILEELKYINDREIFSSTIHWETRYKVEG